MTLSPGLRKFTLTAHVTFSVGWLGVVVAYLALAVTGFASQDVQWVRTAYLAMELIGWFVLVPFSLAALISGIVQSLGTKWGLFRYYWIVAKLSLTLLGTVILLVHMRSVSRMANLVAQAASPSAEFGALQVQLLVHPVGGLLILLIVTLIAMYKPWGMTPYGQRRQRSNPSVK